MKIRMIELIAQYKLKIRDRKIESVILNGEDVDKFRQPVTSKKPKLYAVKDQSEVIYIGITSQSIRSRLRSGLQAQGKHGYHGYGWKKLEEVDLFIWCFDEKPLKWVEGVEAELVYLFRKNTGKWPKHQTEIHFHNATEKQKEEAKTIFMELTKS
jgi:hypothetical protein